MSGDAFLDQLREARARLNQPGHRAHKPIDDCKGDKRRKSQQDTALPELVWRPAVR
jgi:hypothetical protein